MPRLVESPARLSRVLPVALVGHICTGAWLTSATVYFAELEHIGSIRAPAIASAAIGLSYLVSVVLAAMTSLRHLRVGLALIGLGFFVQTIWPWAGSLLVVCGLGLYRPALIAVVGRSDPNRLRAFQGYSIVMNVGYLLGGFLADLVRLNVGYGWLFAGLGFLTTLVLLGSFRLGPGVEEVPPDPLPAPPTPFPRVMAWSILTAVAVFYFVMSQVSTVFSLVAEQQTSLKAGTLGGLHGAFVLLIMWLFSVAQPSTEGPQSLVLGLGLWALALGGLAASSVPIHSGVLVLALLLMSLGEALAGPNLLALGSRLAGLGSNAYWAAATLGYWGCMAYNFGWLERGQAHHFGYVALGCAVVALLAGVARRLRP